MPPSRGAALEGPAHPQQNVVDLDANWEVLDDTSLQLNVLNLFDEDYQATLSTATTGVPNYMIGSPRTFLVTLSTTF